MSSSVAIDASVDDVVSNTSVSLVGVFQVHDASFPSEWSNNNIAC